MDINELLKSKKKVFLDGGTGSEIQRLGGTMGPAFSGLANVFSPEIVIKVHESHINAGCDMITTNTFGTARHCLEPSNLGDQTIKINIDTVMLARQAVKNSGKKIKIAGSMSTYLALAENEFRPDTKFVPSFAKEEKNYKEQAKVLKEEGVEVLILEMLLDIDHAKILLNAALETGLPVWVGLSCCISKFDETVVGRNFRAEKERSIIYDPLKYPDEPKFLPEDKIINFAEIINSLKSIGGDVYGIMHSWFIDTKEGMKVLKSNWNGPIMFYPEIHKFDTSTMQALITENEIEFVDKCSELIDDQVKIIGGCCGVTDKHLKSLITKFS